MSVSLDERFGYLLLGCLIGFVVGYFVRALHEIKRKVDKVDDNVAQVIEEQAHVRNELGLARYPLLLDICLLGVVLMTAFAAVQSQRASNRIQDTQDRVAVVSECNQNILAKTVTALNQRTTYTLAQADANADLQKAQARFLGVYLVTPPVADEVRAKAFKAYYASLTHYVTVSAKSTSKIEDNPYPTTDEYQACLDAHSDKKE